MNNFFLQNEMLRTQADWKPLAPYTPSPKTTLETTKKEGKKT